MSKTKNKNHDEVRFLQGEIKRLNKLVRSLESEIRSHKKHEHMYELSQDEEVLTDSEDTYIKRGVSCGECGKGIYKEFEIRGMTYGTCNICGARKKLK